MVALGLWGHLFSIEPTGADPRRTLGDSEPGNSDDAGGIDALKQQLWAEAMRHGLAQAQDVLVIADAAVWIGT